MNASFRTAFWALCLGLTVPMLLFVGVELTSGGHASRKTALANKDSRGSLRTQLEKKAGSKSSRTGDPELGSPQLSLETEPDLAGVVLDRELEPEQGPAAAEPQRDRRIPAFITGVRPTAKSPLGAAVPSAGVANAAGIETRLADIQRNLDQLGRTIADQSNRKPQGDPVVQVAELLRQLRQARELEKVAELLPEPPPKTTLAPTLPPTDIETKSAPDPVATEIKPPEVKPSVPPQKEAVQGPKKLPRTETKIYRPRYLSASALESMIRVALTKGVGRVGVTETASGDGATLSREDVTGSVVKAVIVRDVPGVLRKIDGIVEQIDVPPAKVMIEATVLTVRLTEAMPNGIDLQGFNAGGRQYASEAGRGPQNGPRSDDARFLTHGYGLKCAVLHGDPRGFISVLNATTPPYHADAWQMTVLDRQSAELLVGDPFGPTGPGGQGAAGTLLAIRPVVIRDGLIYLDVRRATQGDNATTGARAAALTNQFALQEGETAVVGGFYADQLATQYYNTSAMGNVPFLGRMFRKQTDIVERTETIVLLTPHIVESNSGAPILPPASTANAR